MNKYNILFLIIGMFELDQYEVLHPYPRIQPLIYSHSSTLEPWNKVTTPLTPSKNNAKCFQFPKTQQSFSSKKTTRQRRVDSIQKRRHNDFQKQQFPVSMLNFYPESLGLQNPNKKRKSMMNTTVRFKKSFRSGERSREHSKDISLGESESQQRLAKGAFKPSFDYSALLKRKEENKIKFKGILSRKQILETKIPQPFTLKDLSEEKKEDKRKYRKIQANKSLSLIEVSHGNKSDGNCKTPKKPCFVGIRKIMCQRH